MGSPVEPHSDGTGAAETTLSRAPTVQSAPGDPPVLTLVIPTRNRPASLEGVLRYLADFSRNVQVCIADGSWPEHQERNEAAVAALSSRLDINYRSFDPEIGLFDRLHQFLQSLDAEIIVMGSDDDFPVIPTMQRCTKQLLQTPDASTALGAVAHLTLDSPTTMRARFQVARKIAVDDAAKRIATYTQWPFSTTYAATRREVLLDRYSIAPDQFLAGFYDHTIGIRDALLGKILAVPQIGFIGTRNYGHSYVRQESPLSFLRDGPRILELRDGWVRDFAEIGQIPQEQAQTLADRLVRQRLSELVGDAAHRRTGFADAPRFTHPVVQAQYQQFHAVFEDGTEERETFGPLLTRIATEVRHAAQSEDNSGEAPTVTSIKAQSTAQSTGTSSGPAFQPWRPTERSREYPEFVIAVDPHTMTKVDD